MENHLLPVIRDISSGFMDAMVFAKSSENYGEYAAAIRDDIYIVAAAFHKHFPDFDVDGFLARSGYYNQQKR